MRARIGMVNFINTAPLYEIWQQSVQRPEWQVVEAPPSSLNRLLFENELDLGFISSQEYAIHPASYRLLADLSISSSGPVGSVFLLSKIEPAELDGRLVLLSSKSQTSAGLVRILLDEYYRVAPRYITGDVIDFNEEEEVSAVMAIGDEALRLITEGVYPVKIDLGEIWYRHTGLPFVFAVWAVREDFFARAPECVAEIHQELRRCIEEGRRQLPEISRLVAPRIPMTVEKCYGYLQDIEYDLGPAKQEALCRFIESLVRRDEADAGALPLKICGQDK